MSLFFKRVFLFTIGILINFIKTEYESFKSISSMRFLSDKKDKYSITNENNLANKEDITQLNFLMNSIKYIKPLRIFQETSTSSEENEGFKVRCFWLDSKTMRVFDLSGLKTANAKGYLLRNDTAMVKINICEDLMQKCKDTRSQMISYDQNDENTCTRLAGSIVSNNNTWNLLDENNPEKGLKITLNKGDNDLLGKPYKVEIEARCNQNMTEGNSINWISTSVGADKNPNRIVFESKNACPKANFYEVWKLLNDNFWIFGVIMIVFGLFLNFLGSKFVNVTVYILTCLLTIIAFFILMFQFILRNGSSQTTVWIVLGIATIIGAIFGYFVVKFRDWLLAIIIGGYTGFIFGNLLYNIGLKYIEANPQVVMWLTIIVSIAICIFISYKLMENFIIFATSLNGAYLIIRGSSLFFGGFPSESVIIDLISREEFETLKTILTPTVYIYIATWLLLVVLGMYVQCKIKTEEEKEKLNKEADYKFFSKK